MHLKNKTFYCIVLLFHFFSCSTANEAALVEYDTPYDLVNPFIGTGAHGHTYPGATMPFGMVQLSPDTRLAGWDGASGYHNSDSFIYGFSHTHLSGTGVGDYGDVLLSPGMGAVDFNPEVYKSSFEKDNENAFPGFYSVLLNDDSIGATLTTTTRVGIHEYLFHKAGQAHIVLDLSHRDKVLDWQIERLNDSTLIGKRISEAWAKEQHCYFALRTSKEFELLNIDQKSALQFETKVYEKVLVKVGISAVDEAGALRNLNAEAASNHLADYLQNAKNIWTKALQKIEVRGQNADKLSIFYTALYHSMIVPNVFTDVDFRYRGMDQKIHESDHTNIYTVFSLWDTFRATHPLYTIIERERALGFIQTFLRQYREGGRLPVWELAGNETDCMIGYHSVSVMADAYAKGIQDFDTDLALEAMMHSANLNHFGLEAYKTRGYIAAGDEAESVSKTLEYAYDDWCIANFAQALGKDSIASEYYLRALSYKNIFNPELGFMQSKLNGAWSSGFDPSEVNFNFTEANSWQYSMFVPQDVEGLIQLYGGPLAFEKKLDELFTTESKLSGREQADITGLIGQYAHGNEPSHHMAYLYNYIGKPWKTQERVAQIMEEQYANTPEGLSGNEDCGQMSSWYVLSAMGMYAVTPGSDIYVIGTPAFDEIKINLENEKTCSIVARHLSKDNKFIQSITFNNRPYTKSYIKHSDILAGGEWVFNMGPKPNLNCFTEHPVSRIDEQYKMVTVPYFVYDSQSFTNQLLVEIKTNTDDDKIYYSLNDAPFELYDTGLVLEGDAKVQAYAVHKGKRSKEETASFKKIKGGRSIEILSKYSNQYSGGGDRALIDHLEGSTNFRTGFWQGTQGQDVEAIIDLGKSSKITSVSVGALQDIKSWIWMPKSVDFWYSNDKKNWKRFGQVETHIPSDKYNAVREIMKDMKAHPVDGKYVKILAKYPGDCPNWHIGAGGKAWIFLDEITVE